MKIDRWPIRPSVHTARWTDWPSGGLSSSLVHILQDVCQQNHHGMQLCTILTCSQIWLADQDWHHPAGLGWQSYLQLQYGEEMCMRWRQIMTSQKALIQFGLLSSWAAPGQSRFSLPTACETTTAISLKARHISVSWPLGGIASDKPQHNSDFDVVLERVF